MRARKQYTKHLGFRVGQKVHMLVPCEGGLDAGDVSFPAGSPGRIALIEDLGPQQGIGFHVAIWSHDPEQSIVNVFDELDGPPTNFFVAAPDLPTVEDD